VAGGGGGEDSWCDDYLTIWHHGLPEGILNLRSRKGKDGGRHVEEGRHIMGALLIVCYGRFSPAWLGEGEEATLHTDSVSMAW